MLALVRPAAEINTKSNSVRRKFAGILVANIKAALGPEVEVHASRSWGRFYVRAADRSRLQALSQVFGVASYSPVLDRCDIDQQLIREKALVLFGERVVGKRFAVRCRRGSVPGWRSVDVERDIGAALVAKGGKVDLGHPELVVYLELRQEGVFFFDEKIEGPGGLPLGAEGHAICLISGGFDSPVAAWHVMKRGVALDFLFLNLAGAAYERSVIAVTRQLCEGWSHGYQPRLWVVPGETLTKQIRASSKDSYLQLVLKRVMYRLGSQKCQERGAQALVTGEAIGQVSSQTLHNLAAIETAADVPVLRPLIGFEKNDIINLSRKIGTYALCEHVQEYCNLVPKRPVTRASVAAVDQHDAGMTNAMIKKALEHTKSFAVMAIEPENLLTDYLFVEEIPEQALVIDCRPPRHYQMWHYPGSQNLEIETLTNGSHQLTRQPVYVIYCPYGLQSAVVAERMQKSGYQAYSFRGGLKALQAYNASRC